MPLEVMAVLRSYTLWYDKRVESLNIFHTDKSNVVFYNDFGVSPPSSVLCRVKVDMDNVCYDGGLGITKWIFQIPFLFITIRFQDISYTPNKYQTFYKQSRFWNLTTNQSNFMLIYDNF